MAKTEDIFNLFRREFLAGTPPGPSRLAIPSLTGSADAFAAASAALDGKVQTVLVVTPGIPCADRLAADLKLLEKETGVETLEMPMPVEDEAETTAARLKVSATLGAWKEGMRPIAIVAPGAALAIPLPAHSAVTALTVRLENGKIEPFADVLAKLSGGGYVRRVQTVAPGEYSVRGGVLDVWPPGAECPVRAEFFGDELESLRNFDPVLQTSTRKITEAELPPVSIPDSAGQSIFSMLPDGATVMWLEHCDCAETIRRFEKDIGGRFRQIFTGDPAPARTPTGNFLSVPLPGFAETGAEAARDPQLLEAAKTRLERHLRSLRARGYVVAERPELSRGFEIPGLAVVAKSDRVFAHRTRTATRRTRASVGERLDSALDIEPGELVVHVDHGVGRYLDTSTMGTGDERYEVFAIEYADGAMLYVPVTQAHLLSRYVGVKGEEAHLHRLDGRRWDREKKAAEHAVEDLAASLLETQARRAVAPGFAFDTEAEGLAAFEAAFPFEETLDQAQAIRDVKRDMALSKPMDRLICGDAGYGKTEVAMRAACIAALNGKQTAVLAPTTVLAEQHFETFLSRFDGTAVRIEAMSRFQNAEAKKGTIARLGSGATDIVVGTHAILSDRIRFHDLGLIVIDEEQRFGVRQKEWLKRLRATADVLTMSATPIPRTLYLSVTGARDLSILRTPPRERVAVETTVARDSDGTVKAAMERELARGGQVFYLHNRVSTIGRVRARLAALMPQARIETAHGQMRSQELAEKMRAFANGRADVLLCTSIVESGIDIPRANTIIVERADTFGLAELYQLRGRVGRSSRQGYAIFLVPAEGGVDAEARERLDAIRKHSGLGAGFGVAMRDLELRGAGNLLGAEQSGHIAAIGFQLYCQLLQRTVARMKGEKVHEVVEVTFDFDFLDLAPGTSGDDGRGAGLPYDYVEEDSQRLELYRRFASAATLREVRALGREMADRFGRPPPAAKRFVRLAELRVLCAQAGVGRAEAHGGTATFFRRGTSSLMGRRTVKGTTADAKIASIAKCVLEFGIMSPPRKEAKGEQE